ncbi:MAG: hydrogenase maturation protease [Candidatus Schekmanbacteria bacterium]|nr:hydrogenase maturation protease [Candidatus Schekmanbacteria bacterium]
MLVIGVGNAWRGDDGFGLVVAEALADSLPEVAVKTASGDGAALMSEWEGAELVIIVDAVRSGAAPGTLHRLDASAGPLPPDSLRCSSHAFGVAEAIELSRALGTMPRRLVVHGVSGQTFAAGTDLSPPVRDAVGPLLKRIRDEVAALTLARESAGHR